MKQVKISCKFIVVALVMLSASVKAQIAYQCDFENATERAAWTLNKLPNNAPQITQYNNVWYDGQLGNASQNGQHGLYVSNDQGATLHYSSQATNVSYMVSYRDNITLTAGTQYTIRFDYISGGMTKQAGVDGLYVCVVPSSTATNSNKGTLDVPNFVKNNTIATLSGKIAWTPYSGTFVAPDNNCKLAVVWVSYAGNVSSSAAAIDNIEITTASCPVPTNLTYTGSGAMTWNGTASSYDVRLYCVADGSWSEASVNTRSYTPTLKNGYHYFFVRSVCGPDSHSDWVSIGQFMYDKSSMCIDYLDLDAASCYTGTADATSGGWSGTYSAWTNPGKVDYGFASSSSQHTVHYMPGEMDPRTNNQLPTIPPGEIASVRLGNWEINSHAEGISYKLKVQAGASDILKLKYATVLESGGHDPGGPEAGPHGGNEQAHFYVEVRNQQGIAQGQGCETFDFSATSGTDNTWHQIGDSYSALYWKEWTEVSISLANYIGQTIEIRLATYDCTASGHFGYAYFTMSCAGGKLEGVSCGDFNIDHFEAPEGFNYRWYKQGTSTVVSRNRTFQISPQDTTIYLVDVINKVNGCYYTLTANPNPRFPQAEMTNLTEQTVNCENVLTLKNKSEVYVINRQTGLPMVNVDDEHVDDVILDWGDGSAEEHTTEENLRHVYPNKGGKYKIKAYASMNGGVCVDTVEYEVEFPNIEDAGKQDTTTYHRVGSTAKGLYTGKSYTATGEQTFYDTKTIKNEYGCDVECTHKIIFRNDIILPLDATVCQGSAVTFSELYGSRVKNDTVMRTAGQYERRHTHTDVMIFDTTFALTLKVQDTIRVEVPDTIRLCGRDEAAFFTVIPEQGNYIGVNVVVGEKGQNAGLNANYMIENRNATYDEEQRLRFDMPDTYVRPDFYPIELEFPSEDGCTVQRKKAILEVRYGTEEFLDQKFGFVFLLNADNNYGQFEYATYEWYRDSVLMPDEHDSYINVTDADLGHKYYVVVTRQGETTPVPSCEIEYTSVNPLSIGNTWRNKTVRAIYDLLGRKLNDMNAHGAYIVIYDDGSNEKIIY